MSVDTRDDKDEKPIYHVEITRLDLPTPGYGSASRVPTRILLLDVPGGQLHALILAVTAVCRGEGDAPLQVKPDGTVERI